jgi:hypothetical protein
MVKVSSNPHAWLVPFWAELKRQTFFDHLAPELQAAQLAVALDADHPAKAQEIREWNPATRRAMLAVLEMGVAAGPAKREIELWKVQRGEREVRCVAVYLPTGVDLRLIEDDEVLRTELFSDGASVVAVARRWRAGR